MNSKNIGKKHRELGYYANIISDGRKGRKPRWRGVFGVWNGSEWRLEYGTSGIETKADAQAWLDDKVETFKTKGIDVYLNPHGFASYVENVYKPYLVSTGIQTAQEFQKLDTMIEFFGDRNIDDLKQLDFAKFKNWLTEKPYQRKNGKNLFRTEKTVNRYLARLRHLLNKAVRDEVRTRPASFTDLIVGEESSDAQISLTDFFRLLDACNFENENTRVDRKKWRLPLIASLELGCRVGELKGIKRSDMRLDVVNRVGVFEIVKNKTKKAKIEKKLVPFTSWLYDEMERESLFELDENSLMFDVSNYRKAVVRGSEKTPSLFELAGIDKNAVWHTLRATNATLKDMANNDYDSLQSSLGHSKGSSATKGYIRPNDATTIEKNKPFAEFLKREISGGNVLDADTLE